MIHFCWFTRSKTVVLDLVELLFKEQYLNGNDMLRIKKHMVQTRYTNKNLAWYKKIKSDNYSFRFAT